MKIKEKHAPFTTYKLSGGLGQSPQQVQGQSSWSGSQGQLGKAP